jgi:hypothetical protein
MAANSRRIKSEKENNARVNFYKEWGFVGEIFVGFFGWKFSN